MWTYLVPPSWRKKLRPQQWEDKIFDTYRKLRGMTRRQAQERYIRHVSQWPFYGCSFFPCCEFMPPGGFFELRTQRLLLGVNTAGVCLFDQAKQVSNRHQA
jgi:hypothetical protein